MKPLKFPEFPVKLSSLMNFSLGYKNLHSKAGLPPGTPIYTGTAPAEPVSITLIEYDEAGLTEKHLPTVGDSFACRDHEQVSWINIDGLHEVEMVQQMGQNFGLHSLVVEDIVHVGQRPKMEDHDSYLFIVMKMLTYRRETQSVDSEQVSFVLTNNGTLMTFQERQGDVFEQIRERIRTANGRIRKMPADYLAYALMDAILDNYFHIMDVFGEKIETLEMALLEQFDHRVLGEIHSLKRDLSLLRKSVWPIREMVGSLERSESALIHPETRMFLRDLYDHSIQIIDTIESFRDVTSSLMDLYLSMVSNRMNEIMKVLTLIATIFIPLGFVAGVFGMNFQNMPELGWRWAYPAGFWGVIAAIVVGMLIFFKRKKWL